MSNNHTRIAIRNHLGLSVSGSVMIPHRGYQIVVPSTGDATIWTPEGKELCEVQATAEGLMEAMVIIDQTIEKEWQ